MQHKTPKSGARMKPSSVLRPPTSDFCAGFSLIELMIVVAIIGVTLAIGVPSFNSLTLNSRLNTQANTVLSSMLLARSEAIKRGYNVRVTPVSACSTPCTEWGEGWQVVLDRDGDDSVDSDDEVVRYFETLKKSTLAPEASSVTEISFLASGFTKDASEMELELKDEVCTTGRERMRVISVAPAGFVQSERKACP